MGLYAVCAVHWMASGWHPSLLLHTASLPHWPCLLLAAGFPWQPQSVHTTPLSTLPPFSEPGCTCILPFPDSPIHQHTAVLRSVLAFIASYIYVSLCLWMCVHVSLAAGQSKFGLKEAVCFRMPPSSKAKGPVCSAYKWHNLPSAGVLVKD